MNKVRVVAVPGGSATLGLIDPVLDMVTDQGAIRAIDAGNLMVTVSGAGVSEMKKAYTYHLSVTQAVATGTFSYPTGDGSVAYGHSATTIVPVTSGYFSTGEGNTPFYR